MEATIQKQVERSWQSKTSVILVALTIMGGYFALTGKFEDDGKKYENHEVRIGQLEADKKEMRDDIKDIKRSNEQIAAPKILVIEDLELDLDRKVARRGGQIIDLTAKEYSLLEYLIRNKNRVISRTEILEKVWSAGFDSTTNVIDVYINFLRKKIDKGFDKKLIHTMVGMGYIIKSVD